MNWEETILEVRANPVYNDLVREAYLGPNLEENVKRFSSSAEFQETIKELSGLTGKLKGLKLLDIGAGNGISTIAFAMLGVQVTALEPDPSNTIGAGAIRLSAKKHNVSEALWAYPYSLFYAFTLFWITPYAIATAGRSGWLTRDLTKKEIKQQQQQIISVSS